MQQSWEYTYQCRPYENVCDQSPLIKNKKHWTSFSNDDTQQAHYAIMGSLLRQNDLTEVIDVNASKWRRFDLITTLLLRQVFSGY